MNVHLRANTRKSHALPRLATALIYEISAASPVVHGTGLTCQAIKPLYIILTTYPEKNSANVGDKLIAESFIALLRIVKGDFSYRLHFRATVLSDEILSDGDVRAVLMPGFSVAQGSHPNLFALRSDYADMQIPMIPFGCTWQHAVGCPEAAMAATFTESDIRLLHHLLETGGPIACRDEMLCGILRRNGVAARLVGDLAWYHLGSIGKPMRRPTEIRKLVFTTPHNPLLAEQAEQLLAYVAQRFPSAQKYISLHSRPSSHDRRLVRAASRLGYTVVMAFGDTAALEFYADCDLHVGYRLHGHIAFLARRVPSVLLIEDARSHGLAATIPQGCFSARRSLIDASVGAQLPMAEWNSHVVADDEAVDRVAAFVDEEMQSAFGRQAGIGRFIDQTLQDEVIPALRAIP